MQATTIKIENPLLDNIRRILPKSTSLTAFVKDLLEKEIKRAKMLKAADDYMLFLQNHPKEKDELGEWENSDLQSSPQPRISKRKK